MISSINWSTFDAHICENFKSFSRLYANSLTLARIADLESKDSLSSLHPYKYLVHPFATDCMIESCKLIGLANDNAPSVLKQYKILNTTYPLLQQILVRSKRDFDKLRLVRNKSVAHRTEPCEQQYYFSSTEIFPIVNKIGFYLVYLANACKKHDPAQKGLLETMSLFTTHDFIRMTQVESAITLDEQLFTKSRNRSIQDLRVLMNSAIALEKKNLGLP